MTESSRSIKYMLIFLWLLVPLVFVAGVITWYLTGEADTSFISNYFDTPGSDYADASRWPLYLVDTKDVIDSQCGWLRVSTVAVNFLFVAALQLLYTIALHVVEQFVNLHRDEWAWRHASTLNPTTGGALIGRNATKAALTAWPTVFLFAMKPLCHWIFGLSFAIGYNQMILYHPLPLFALAAAIFLLASFATYLALKQPVGPQPSTYGNLEQLVGMIDDWGKGAGSRIYWGEKKTHGVGIVMRRVGTSDDVQHLTEAKVDGQPYLGMKDNDIRTEGTNKRIRWCL